MTANFRFNRRRQGDHGVWLLGPLRPLSRNQNAVCRIQCAGEELAAETCTVAACTPNVCTLAAIPVF